MRFPQARRQCRQGFGPDGDFITSPELHPAFGALLGRQALELWAALDRPEPFTILEIGGGSGALARALLDCWRAAQPSARASSGLAGPPSTQWISSTQSQTPWRASQRRVAPRTQAGRAVTTCTR